MEEEIQSEAGLAPLNPIRVETALSRYPVHRLARKGSMEICIQEDAGTGTETRWEVDYSKKHGQPGPLAYKLDTLIINRRIEEARRPLSKIIRLGSLKEICRELGMAETGGNTNQIKNSLYQNAFAGITAKTRYKLQDGSERTLEAGFTRYSVILTGEELPSGRKADAVYVILNDIYMNVINGAMTRPLDYDYLKSLTPAPQRFYELLSYRMYSALKYDRNRAKLNYSELCAYAPQTRHFDWEKVRSQMHKVHRPHRESGYIAKVDYQDTVDAEGKPDWIMLYLPGPKARAEYRAFTKRGGPTMLEIAPEAPLPLLPEPAESELERELCRRGVTATVASELARSYSEELIRSQMERVDWLAVKKPDKIGDTAAYLVQAIKSDFAAPKGFVSQAERERREEAKRVKEQKAAERHRQEHEAAAREKAAEAEVDAYLRSLTPEALAELDAAALAEADPASLSLETPQLKKLGQLIRQREYARRQLAARKQEASKG